MQDHELTADCFVCEAELWAREAHVGQRRKYTDEPYIVHPQRVAMLVESVTDDEATIATAWLHDIVEDTPTTIEQIKETFGDEVATLVSDVTNVTKKTDGKRSIRKAIEREHLAHASPKAKTVKLADIIDNIPSIVEHDPNFARIFVAEKLALLDCLTDGDKTLFEMASQLISKSMRALDMN